MSHSPTQSESGTSSRDGWLVIGALAIALVVIPWALIVLPEARGIVGAIGFSMRDAYLVVPLVPAIGLGVVGVWTAIRARRSQ
ncbi:hypothetical protein HLRTI_002370 [Halorhabdus tiamatea SARL4B]|uniref:Uncharacterized protein n=1 Tax=Halorhabdus tiamatea SARL4B TaxID=1033806 RepID=F7PH53_9EURY|nr:hypothetical protein [Halorhabdus tiamatea]ERJ05642.1 hypothetical protein HLRTI_002370 [Halorhabdus tiamatea SARL4B]CCQ32471.1 conserved hypothetical protein [Halorhabdus tiamatea SARL4B]